MTLTQARSESGANFNRIMVTVSVMLATIMQALDTTIANVALPNMQGAMGATQDQISWVLTSYIVAAAICMPLTGFIAGKFGRKRLFLWSVVGFTVASVLCGMAQSLNQIILFRLLQGVFGASLVPLSQAILLDSYPREKHGAAMAMWGVGVMVGPILGPFLGGLLTEYYSWRWVFYINVPFGILAWLGITGFVKETTLQAERKFDFFGFFLLAIGIGALQMMLDRGETLDWFNSLEVVVECGLAVLGLYMFIVHINTHHSPFIDTRLFRDRNFAVGLVFIFVVGVILLATMALLPPFMQNLMGYPVVDVGTVLAPRGFGTMAMMLVVGRLSGKVDPRIFIFVGLSLVAFSMWEMTHFTLDSTSADIIRTGMVQGAGLGLTFVPLSTVAFATLDPSLRTEASSLFSLLRNIGSSIGISIVSTYLIQQTQVNHAIFSESINPFNLGLSLAEHAGVYSTQSTAGLVALNSMVTGQAATMAYLQDFRMMMWVTIAALPLVLLLGGTAKPTSTKMA